VVLTGNPPRACLLPELRCATELLPQTCLSAYLRSNRRSHLSGLLRVFAPELAPLHVLPDPACGGVRLVVGALHRLGRRLSFDSHQTLILRPPFRPGSRLSPFSVLRAPSMPRPCSPGCSVSAVRFPAGSPAFTGSRSQGRRGGEPPASLNLCIPPAAPSVNLPDCSGHLSFGVTAGDSRITSAFCLVVLTYS